MGVRASAPKKQELAVEAPIFKLTADCCDEIFDYLSLKDLHSFGQTCKTFNKVAGEYFKRNYSAKCFHFNYKGIYTTELNENISLSCLYPYITKVYCIDTFEIEHLAQHVNKLGQIKGLHCSEATLIQPKIKQKILPRIEYLKFYVFGTASDRGFVDKLMEKCPNLKSLNMKFCRTVFYNYRWLHQVYPNLMQIKFDSLPLIKDVIIFLEQNPNVRSFSVQAKYIWENQYSFLSSTIKLDLLEIKNFANKWVESFNQLYERGFYKRLHLKLGRFDQQWSDKLLTLQGLEKLSVSEIPKGHKLPQLTQLKRLDLRFALKSTSYQNLHLANALVKLERISLLIESSNDVLLPLFRRSINLNKIRMEVSGGEKVLNLSMLNKEREKLVGARKVTIYVEDDVYVATKWATENGDTNLSLVEMRRISSCEWNEF